MGENCNKSIDAYSITLQKGGQNWGDVIDKQWEVVTEREKGEREREGGVG